ncbi:integrase [Stenotrophomonas maltophilia 5BA-I-2]|nr:integrase [Stenotrophomonas maltophilia 5BA-I-2]
MCCIDLGASDVIAGTRFFYARRMMRNTVRDGVLSLDDRFGLHSLKHRGVTDTKGDKKEASGHKTDAMMHVYDHSLPVVPESGG